MDHHRTVETNKEDEVVVLESQYQKGVRHLCDTGLTKVPTKYVLPILDRPCPTELLHDNATNYNQSCIKLPIIDFDQLLGSNRSHALNSLAKACEEYGFFQLTNHGIASEAIHNMMDVGKRFFELPFEERSKYMSKDVRSPVRYGTSINQSKDRVFCWRDFLKLSCHPLSQVFPSWPASPVDLREATVEYSKETKTLYLILMEAILESLGILVETTNDKKENDDSSSSLKEFEDGSQIIVVNCYPCCPEPELTLGMSPHSDFGFLTLLLQDEVKGLQIQHQGKWLAVEPLPNSFVVNVGDHLEIFSNGRYKSVLHRVLVNPYKSRISVASLHSLPFNAIVKPSPKLINEVNPRRYMDTDFATFLEFLSSCEPKTKDFLESRKLT